MSFHLRNAQPGLETLEIYQALLRLQAKSPAKQMVLVEPNVALQNLQHAVEERSVYVYGDYAIKVDVGSPWYTSKPLLIEEIILRFRKDFGNHVSSAIQQLDAIAKEKGCVAIAAGDTQIGLMSQHYHAEGYSPIGTQFFKEIAHGLHP